MLLLQLTSAILLLLNKYFVFRKKTVGWIYGIWGTIAITVYFYLQMVYEHKYNLWIMVVYDVALVFFMLYGYAISHSENNVRFRNTLKKYGFVFKLIIAVIAIVVCTIMLVQAINSNLVITQFLSVIGGLSGTLLLAVNKKQTNKIGWIVYFITHCIVTYLMIMTDSPAIAVCQVFSAIVALLGFRDESKKR